MSTRTGMRKAAAVVAADYCRAGLVRPRGWHGPIAALIWWRKEIAVLAMSLALAYLLGWLLLLLIPAVFCAGVVVVGEFSRVVLRRAGGRR